MTTINEKTMQDQYQKAHAAIENEANKQTAVALKTVIKRLNDERLKVMDKLANLPAIEWMTVPGRAMASREQELHTALVVLRGEMVKEYRARECAALAATPAASNQEKERWCKTMDRPASACGCPDCGSSLIDFPSKTTPTVGLDRARNYVQADAQQIAYDEVVESIRERDEAEEFGDKLLDLVLGNDRPEWSSAYGTDDALLQVEERMAALEKQARTACVVTKEAKP